MVRLRFPSRLSLLQVIRNQHGGTAVKVFHKFEKVDFNHRKAALELNFLQTCRSFNVIPIFLQIRVTNKSLQRSQAYQKCLNYLLSAEINNNKKNLQVLINEFSSGKSNLLHILNFLDFNHVSNIIISKNEKPILKCKYTHIKKLRDLVAGCKVNPSRFSHDPNKIICNFSLYVLAEHEKSLLCKGLRFSVPPKKYDDFLTQFEFLHRDTIMFEMKSENRDFLKNKLKEICFSTLKLPSFDKFEKIIRCGVYSIKRPN